MNSDEIILELATGSTLASSAFGSGVNEALATQAAKIVEQIEAVAMFRKYAADTAQTDSSAHEMAKFTVQAYSNGGDISDGGEPVYTVIDNQDLIQFTDATAYNIQVGVKLTPKLLRQARTDASTFLAKYRAGMARNVAVKEDIYIGSVLGASPETDSCKVIYGGNATTKATLAAGHVITTSKIEDMIDEFKEQSENVPTQLFLRTRQARQLRDDARVLNASTYNLAIKEDGMHVRTFGDDAVEVHEIKGVNILPTKTDGGADYSEVLLLNEAGAFGLVYFEPVKFFVGEPDPTITGTNFHRMLVTSRVECKVLDEQQLVVGRFTLA